MPATYDPYQLVTRSSLSWPSHWRKTIYKMERCMNPSGRYNYVRVFPYNPAYMRVDPEGIKWVDTKQAPYLDPIEFETPEKLDQWALVVARIT